MNLFIKVFLTFFFSISIYAEREIEFSLNSDSIWRGLTQNNGNPTLGMDLNILLKNGLTTGIWIESCCSESSSYCVGTCVLVDGGQGRIFYPGDF